MINAITIQGRLTRNPDYRKTPAGTPVCNFNIACRQQSDSPTHRKQTPLTIRVSAFSHNAELTRTLAMNDMVIVCGRLKENNFVDNAGIERRDYAVVLQECHLLYRAPKTGKAFEPLC